MSLLISKRQKGEVSTFGLTLSYNHTHVVITYFHLILHPIPIVNSISFQTQMSGYSDALLSAGLYFFNLFATDLNISLRNCDCFCFLAQMILEMVFKLSKSKSLWGFICLVSFTEAFII